MIWKTPYRIENQSAHDTVKKAGRLSTRYISQIFNVSTKHLPLSENNNDMGRADTVCLGRRVELPLLTLMAAVVLLNIGLSFKEAEYKILAH